MKSLHDIVGQESAVGILIRMLEKGRVPHALLFTGIDGSGRQTTARALAMAMNCGHTKAGVPCGSCRACRKMMSGNHPDLVIVRPSGVAIKIDQVRSLRKQLRYAPVDGGQRVIIIDDAQTLNPQASNALLKTLEEPPDHTHIILTALEKTDLLDTIVSRCQHVAFRPISMETIVTFLGEQKGMDSDTARCVALLSKGSLGRALSAKTEKWTDWRGRLMERLIGITEASIPSLFVFAEDLSRDKERLPEALDMVAIWFRDLLMWKVCPGHILNKDYMAQIERLSPSLSQEALLKKITAVFSAQRHVTRNVNRRLALEVMMMVLGSGIEKRGVMEASG